MKDYIFAVPADLETSKIILIPVPWDVTTSYGSGASEGPELIFKASSQVDLYDLEVKESYQSGYFMLGIPHELKDQNKALRKKATPVMATLNEGGELKSTHLKAQAEINEACEQMCTWVYEKTKTHLKKNQIVGIVGGDHSVPLGAIKAIGEKYRGDFGILHIDAHLDLRNAYHGFKHSHASIMYNVFNSQHRPKQITQFGIRDFCKEEYDLVQKNPDYFDCHFDTEVQNRKFKGETWMEICEKAIAKMPENIYISFDIDGLNPTLCPGTGTPVPGGLNYSEVLVLLSLLAKNKKKIIGFDLVEVAPGANNDEWNGNVGARLLFKLCGWAVQTNKQS